MASGAAVWFSTTDALNCYGLLFDIVIAEAVARAAFALD